MYGPYREFGVDIVFENHFENGSTWVFGRRVCVCMYEGVWKRTKTFIHTQTLRIPSLKRLCIVYNRIWINLTKLLVKIFIMSSRIFYWGLRSSHWVNVYCVRFQCFFFPNFMYAHSSAHSICVRLLSVCLLAATETWWVLKFSRCACD